MKKNYKNKIQKDESVKEVVKHKYTFPKIGMVIEASSLEEAVSIIEQKFSLPKTKKGLEQNE